MQRTDENIMHIDHQSSAPGTDTIRVPGATGITGMVDFGFPEDQVTAALQVMASVKTNEWNVQSTDLMAVLGRPAVSFEDWATRNAAAFS